MNVNVVSTHPKDRPISSISLESQPLHTALVFALRIAATGTTPGLDLIIIGICDRHVSHARHVKSFGNFGTETGVLNG